MSIINQALQKAQRAQLMHSQQEAPHLAPVRLVPVTRRRRAWLPVGLLAAVSIWIPLHLWLAPQGPGPTGETVVLGPPAPAADSALPPRSDLALPEHAAQDTLRAPDEPVSTPIMVAMPLPRVTVAPPPVPPAPVVPAPDASPETSPGGTPAAVAPGSIEAVRAQAFMQRALAAQEAGELTRALRLLEQAVQLDPTAKAAYNSLGNVYYQQQRYQQAVAMYDRALAIDPDYVKARNNLGSAYMQLAMHARAIEELHRALQADGTYGLTYYNLACVYARDGDGATAAQYLRQAIALEPQARAWAQTDADFAPVRTAPAVQQLLGR